MAAGRNNLTRRQVLGAAAGVPLAAAAGTAAAAADSAPPPGLNSACPEPVEGSKPGSRALQTALRQAQGYRGCCEAERQAWHRALAGFRRAEARLAAFRRYEAALPAAARAFPACEPLEERSDELESARLAALRRLLRAPAPDLPALALKIALAVDDEIAFFAGGDLCLAAIKADSRRLASDG